MKILKGSVIIFLMGMGIFNVVSLFFKFPEWEFIALCVVAGIAIELVFGDIIYQRK